MSPRWIRTQDELRELARRLESASIVALDSESDSFHHYQEKVCLLQVATEAGESYLVDTLELKDLHALDALMAAPTLEKVFHGADYDVATLRRDFGFRFASLFDTMVASRFLGRPEVGLQASLAKEFGVVISKDFQRTDWSVRPLSPQQEEYAAADVLHLIPLCRRLQAELRATGRDAWVREECDSIAQAPAASAVREPADFLRAKGARDLSPLSLAVLRELYALREDWARRLDRPLFKVIPDEALFIIALRRPADERALARIPGCPASVKRNGRDLIDAVRRGEATPKDRLPVFPVRERIRNPNFDRTLIDRLKSWRAGAADRMKLDPGLLLPQRLIDRIARERPKDRTALTGVDGLRGWRIEAFGNELLDVLVREPAGGNGDQA